MPTICFLVNRYSPLKACCDDAGRSSRGYIDGKGSKQGSSMYRERGDFICSKKREGFGFPIISRGLYIFCVQIFTVCRNRIGT